MSNLGYVCLDTFLRRLAFEKGLIRVNRGNSIVPLALVNFGREGFQDAYTRTLEGKFPATVCQRTGTVFLNSNLSKKYSAGTWIYSNYKVLEIRMPKVLVKNEFITVEAVNIILMQDLYED